jgi:hypothetical protein
LHQSFVTINGPANPLEKFGDIVWGMSAFFFCPDVLSQNGWVNLMVLFWCQDNSRGNVKAVWGMKLEFML